MSEFNLREVTPDDASVMVQLWLEVTDEVAAYEPIYTPAISHADLTVRLAKALREELKAYVVYSGGTLAAYVTFRLEQENPIFAPGRYLFVVDLDVSAAFRRRGLSRSLMEKVEAYAKMHEVHRIELSVTYADPRAKEVWARHGFKPHLMTMHKTVE